jgi:hypothetical protein
MALATRGALAAAVALMVGGGPAAAEPPQGHLDVFYVPSARLEQRPGGGNDDSGTGFGVKGLSPASETLVFTGEYQAISYDFAGDFNQLRAGVGVIGPRGGGVLVEYISLEEFIEADGFGVHLRGGSDNAYFQIGYVSLEDDFEAHTGLELASGFAGEISDSLGMFFDARYTSLEGEVSGFETATTDIRAGLRLTFGR